MGLEPASPNFKLGKVLQRTLVIDIQVVAPNQPMALRTVLLASVVVDLQPVIECEFEFRDSTWSYLRKKYLTDFVKEIVFPDDHTYGYRIGLPPATIAVDRITFDNVNELTNRVFALR